MISKSIHPWGNFLYARRLAMQWLRDELEYDDEKIAHVLSMDKNQVTLLLMTEVEEDAETE